VVSAIAACDAGDVLLTLGALLADGWGPPQLATELVDDFRQAFLAALAPELCAVSGSQRARFTELAESMGLARVVRTMEILGLALIDMRDAPDAQVVLEIAAVRAARADLDQGTAALAERVSALERAAAAGTHTVLRPTRSEPDQSEAPQAIKPAEVARRPSVGAVQRSRTDQVAPAAESDDPGLSETAVASPPDPDAGASFTARRTVDRDSVTQAWGDGVLHNLSARAKALYSAGRFVAVDERGAQFALPNVAHRDRCLELAPQVEAALSAHFDTPIRLILVVEGGPEGPSMSGTTISPVVPPNDGANGPQVHAEVELEEEDPEDFRAVPTTEDHQSAAVDRLLEAFPGTSEIDE
jgi:DNA polymerase III gamma/tau subunit